ncbi:DHA2 family efflux MFS transporter permease subunit [Actinokineospora enzanensis]|uniref:DHA2 family efflux MFS transporter permease subunit n=1 Tax=Actinokineospora enzanensis TaxID=155975 RepID=UPI0003704DF7|nr:DHA2 family efflux MFS transporter permease subunit [Actinokineospora enzanensis]
MTTGHSPADTGLRPDTRRLVGVLLLGAVLPLLDSTIVNVALDGLAGAFAVPIPAVQWVVTGYAMATAVAIPVSAWAIRRLGGKRVWLVALSGFLVGSALCGAAWDLPSLVVFRVVQGLSAGLSMPVLQTLLVRSAGPEQARRALTAIGVPAVIAPVLGPVVGGLVLAAADWRWIFLVNVPLCAAGLLLARRGIADDAREPGGPFDPRGFALSGLGSVALVHALARVGTHGADLVVVLSAVVGLSLLAAFVAHSRQAGRGALLDLGLFRAPPFVATACALFTASAVFYAGLVLFPLYYQRVLHHTVLFAGLVLAVQGIGALVARQAVGRFTDRWGPRAVVLVGALASCLGTVPFFVGATALPWQVAGLVLRGAGIGVVTVSVMATAYHGIPRSSVPDASTISRVLLQFGGAVGAAGAAALLTADDAYRGAFCWLLAATALIVIPAAGLPGRAKGEQS